CEKFWTLPLTYFTFIKPSIQALFSEHSVFFVHFPVPPQKFSRGPRPAFTHKVSISRKQSEVHDDYCRQGKL
ncbi:hypothetical protein V6C16_10635, partial [Desulfovibrio sp. 1188_IL3213]|uniref:hypothetical protein n=1 Tax=Desulfovibrio sp. 1188_IL3213 TaxID=3084052 RepID=UPI002FDB86DC